MSDAHPEAPRDPNTHHPDFTDQQAAFVRRYIAEKRGGNVVTLIMSSDPAWWSNESTEFTQNHLRILKARAQAPFVGPPFDYYWYCAMDDAGRWISGPVWAVERMDGWLWESPRNRVIWARTLNDFEWRHHDAGKEPQS